MSKITKIESVAVIQGVFRPVFMEILILKGIQIYRKLLSTLLYSTCKQVVLL